MDKQPQELLEAQLQLAETRMARNQIDEAIGYADKAAKTNDERGLRLAMELHYRQMLLHANQGDWGQTLLHAERVRDCCISLGMKFITVDPKYRDDSRYYF